VKVLVTASSGATVADVAARLDAAGVRVEKVLEAVGVIVATVADSRVRALADIEGVGSVEPDREVRLPPPDSDVQ
jgi:hypothetical protein